MGIFNFLKKNKNFETDNGLNKLYGENGRGSLEEEYFKTNGIKNGKFISYDGLGSIKAEGDYKDGKKEGKWTYWYDSGQLHKNYNQGRIIKKDKLIREWKDCKIKIEKAGKGRFNLIKGEIKIALPKTIDVKKINKEEAVKIINEYNPILSIYNRYFKIKKTRTNKNRLGGSPEHISTISHKLKIIELLEDYNKNPERVRENAFNLDYFKVAFVERIIEKAGYGTSVYKNRLKEFNALIMIFDEIDKLPDGERIYFENDELRIAKRPLDKNLNSNQPRKDFGESYENGQVKRKGELIWNIEQQKYVQVDLWTSYWENGNLDAKVFFNSNGEADGPYICYFPNGNISEEGFYLLGKQFSLWKFYYESGKIKSEENFNEQGIVNGEIRKYYENGKILIEGNYENGEKIGKWKLYKENGEIEFEANDPDKIKKFIEGYIPNITNEELQKKIDLNQNEVEVEQINEVLETNEKEEIAQRLYHLEIQKKGTEILLKDIDKSGVEYEQKKSFRNYLNKEIDTLNKKLDDTKASYSERRSETSDDPKP